MSRRRASGASPADSAGDPGVSPEPPEGRAGASSARRRAATPEELDRARLRLSELRRRLAEGDTLPQVSREWHLPVSALERVLSEPLAEVATSPNVGAQGPPPPGTSDPLTSPAAGPPSAPPPSPSDDSRKFRQDEIDYYMPPSQEDTDPYAPRTRRGPRNPLDTPGPLAQEPALSFYTLMVQSGLPEPKCRLVAKAFRRLDPRDYEGLRRLLGQAGIANQLADLLVTTYRGDIGDPPEPTDVTFGSTPSGAATGGTSLFAKIQQDDERDLQRQYIEARIQAIRQGHTGGGGEAEELRRQNAALLEEKRSREQRDAFQAMLAAQVAPLAAAVEEMRKTSAQFNSIDQVQIDQERRRVLTQDRAMTGLVEVLTQRAKESGSLQALAKSIVHATSPEVQRTALTFVKELKLGVGVNGPAGPPEPPPPTPGEVDLSRTAEMLRGMSGGPRA